MDHCNDKTLLLELLKGYEPGSSHWVTITHINNPHSFYARAKKYDQLLEKLELQVPDSKNVSLQDWIVFNLSSTSDKDKFVRGQILSTHQEGESTVCDVLTIDYGFLQKDVPLKCVWKCKDDIRYIPPLAIHCQLANCAPIGDGDWSKESIDAIKFYVGDERAKMVVIGKTGDKLNVNLINTCPDDIATILALTGFSTLGYSHNVVSRMPAFVTRKKFFKFKHIIEKETLHVRMQYGSSLNEFYVAEIGDYKNYIKNKDNMANFANQKKGPLDEELGENMPVCVLDDLRKPERAVVKSFNSSTSKAAVQLVDSGKKLTAHVMNMKHIPDIWLNDTAIAIYCSVEKCQVHDFRLNHILQPGYEFLITIKELGHNLDSPNIVSVTGIEKS